MKTLNRYVIYMCIPTFYITNDSFSANSQKNICIDYIKSQQGEVMGEYIDFEGDSNNIKTEMIKAFDRAISDRATIVLAKLGRLAYDSDFTSNIINKQISIYVCDFPTLDAYNLSFIVKVIDYDRKINSINTKAGISQIQNNIDKYGFHISKRSGKRITKLGNPDRADYAHDGGVAASEVHREKKESSLQWRQSYNVATDQRRQGKTYKEITEFLNGAELKNSKGGTWSISGVRKMLMDK